MLGAGNAHQVILSNDGAGARRNGRIENVARAVDGAGGLRSMNSNGPYQNGSNGAVLNWPGRVLTADDLRRHLNGRRELMLSSRTVVTPLAAEQIRINGLHVTREPDRSQSSVAGPNRWGYRPGRAA